MPIAATSTVSLTERFHEMSVGPMVGSSNLTAAITRKTSPDRLRIWQLSFTNAGNAAAQRGRLNSFTLVPTTEGTGCQAKLLLPTPLPFGRIPSGATRKVDLPVAFSPLCRDDETYRVYATFSANNGADVGSLMSTETH
jgi:alpha-galactosidase